MRSSPLIAVSTIFLLLGGFGCQATTNAAANTPSGTVSTTKTIDTTTTSPSFTSHIKADVTTTVTCGSEDCFQKEFAACKPATMAQDLGTASFSYTIIGPVTGGCSMTVEYPKNPNPAWVNQPMTCTFDNTVFLEKAAQTTLNAAMTGKSDCVGPLSQILAKG